VAAEAVACTLQDFFEIWSVVNFPVLNQHIARVLIAHGLVPKGRSVLDGKTATSQTEHGAARRNQDGATIVRSAMRLGIEHGAQRRCDLIRGQIAQQCCNTTHSTSNSLFACD
jgi:hypothetical protein